MHETQSNMILSCGLYIKRPHTILIDAEKQEDQMRHDAKQHFSHEHLLIPIETEDGEEIKCHGCEEVMEDPFYGCPACEYFLDTTCFDAPRSMQHPSHPSHPLALVPTPTYPTRSYGCDACGLQGKSFSYACAGCEFDLHLHCAAAPQTLFIEEEHAHELKLVFEPPVFSSEDGLVMCYVCNENRSYNWLYCCEECKHVLHLTCLLSKYDEDDRETDGGGGSDVVSVEGKESSTVGKQETAAEDGNEDVLKVISMMEKM